jgi:hypothetical protein
MFDLKKQTSHFILSLNETGILVSVKKVIGTVLLSRMLNQMHVLDVVQSLLTVYL